MAVAGGYYAQFCVSLDESCACPICHGALREPVVTHCGHQFCKGCMESHTRVNGLLCAVCRQTLTEAEIYPNNFLKRQILDLKVYCDQKDVGCDWMGELRNQENHNDECEFVMEACHNLCGEEMIRKEMESHMHSVCRRRIVECQYCHECVEYKDKEDHYGVCQMFLVTCDCGEQVVRRDMDHHTGSEGTCVVALHSCEFTNAGCQVKAKREDLKEHMKNDVATHLSLMMISSEKKLADVRLELATTQRALAQSRSEVKHLEAVISGEFKRSFITSGGVTYVWKIVDWQEQLRRSKLNSWVTSVSSIKSPIFYSGSPGYCISMQHFPDGSGTCKGSHLSFHIFLHKGKFDDQLHFPRLVHCAVSIVDQALDGRDVRKEWDALLPWVKSSTCIGLLEDMMSHQMVTTRSYLLDGSLLVKFQLEC